MMDAKTLHGMWDLMRQRHGIGRRVIAAIPAARVNEHPVAGMRSTAELVTHIYALVRSIPEGVERGEIHMSGDGTVPVADGAALLAHVDACWAAGDAAVKRVTDAQLAAVVKTPWGMDMPGWMCFGVLHDEYLHHRGQLYVYARALGSAPPMMWDFGGNAPEFQPRHG